MSCLLERQATKELIFFSSLFSCVLLFVHSLHFKIDKGIFFFKIQRLTLLQIFQVLLLIILQNCKKYFWPENETQILFLRSSPFVFYLFFSGLFFRVWFDFHLFFFYLIFTNFFMGLKKVFQWFPFLKKEFRVIFRS